MMTINRPTLTDWLCKRQSGSAKRTGFYNLYKFWLPFSCACVWCFYVLRCVFLFLYPIPTIKYLRWFHDSAVCTLNFSGIRNQKKQPVFVSVSHAHKTKRLVPISLFFGTIYMALEILLMRSCVFLYFFLLFMYRSQFFPTKNEKKGE